MDFITLAMAEKYTEAQRLGYSAYEIASRVGYSGVGSGQEVIPGEVLGASGSYVYVSSEVFTGGVVLSAKGEKSGGDTFEISNLRIEVSDDGIWMLFGDLMGDRLLALSFGNATAQVIGVSAGTYVWKEEISGADYWLGDLFGYFTETIHTIDPKFIPGAVLPVLDLTSMHSEEPVQLNATEAATMDAIVSSRAEFLLATQSANGVAWVTSLRKVEVEGTVAFVGACLVPGFGISTASGIFTIPTMAIVKEPETNLWYISVT